MATNKTQNIVVLQTPSAVDKFFKMIGRDTHYGLKIVDRKDCGIHKSPLSYNESNKVNLINRVCKVHYEYIKRRIGR